LQGSGGSGLADELEAIEVRGSENSWTNLTKTRK
jgi:hypothetical protein